MENSASEMQNQPNDNDSSEMGKFIYIVEINSFIPYNSRTGKVVSSRSQFSEPLTEWLFNHEKIPTAVRYQGRVVEETKFKAGKLKDKTRRIWTDSGKYFSRRITKEGEEKWSHQRKPRKFQTVKFIRSRFPIQEKPLKAATVARKERAAKALLKRTIRRKIEERYKPGGKGFLQAQTDFETLKQ